MKKEKGTASGAIKGLEHILLLVDDLKQATAFCRDTLGLPVHFQAGNVAFFLGGKLGVLERSTTVAPLSKSDRAIIKLNAANVDETRRALVKRGVRNASRCRTLPWGSREFYVRGAGGFLIAIEGPAKKTKAKAKDRERK